ncbi:MAG: nucleoside recognition domain-containing protein [Thermodesulfobacteriota bacterium]
MASVVLTGLESSGKSSIFRGLTRGMRGEESNFRGSTVMVRQCYLPECECNLLDTPGIRIQSDSQTTRLAFEQVDSSDTVLIVARGTHIQSELETIFHELKENLVNKQVAIAITFEDKAPLGIYKAAEHYEETLGIPVVVLNARSLSENNRVRLIDLIQQAKKFDNILPIITAPEGIITITPQTTWFENRTLGSFLALLTLLAFFALPVMAAYYLASWLQPIVDEALITPLKTSLQGLPILIQTILIGDYGVLTLGWYSFLWAFPVVAFIGLSVGLLDETGLKDRITAALDPWLRRIGLSGRDLVPVLTGFGCNVVAVFQSRSCSSCTRNNCISMIAFGSACSYQIGASLSLFGSSGNPWLFMPYLAVLFIVSAVHTRIWYGALPEDFSSSLNERAFLQKPSWKGLFWKLRAVIEQFLFQAMPIFLVICAVAAMLQYWGVLDLLSQLVSPVTKIFMLPPDTTPAIIFSILRKDGLLVLNQGDGLLLHSLSVGQVFVLVYLASTLTACLVTLGTVYKETGAANAIRLSSRQAITSIVSALLIVIILRVF